MRYLRYGQRKRELRNARLRSRRLVRRYVYVRVQEGRIGAKYKPGSKAAWKALGQPDLLRSPVIIIIKSTLRAVRALVKECFISPTRPRDPGPPFRRPSGYATYGETTLASSRPLSVTPSPFDQHAPSFPFRATLPFDHIRNVKTCRGLPFTPPANAGDRGSAESRDYILFLALARSRREREERKREFFSSSLIFVSKIVSKSCRIETSDRMKIMRVIDWWEDR